MSDHEKMTRYFEKLNNQENLQARITSLEAALVEIKQKYDEWGRVEIEPYYFVNFDPERNIWTLDNDWEAF